MKFPVVPACLLTSVLLPMFTARSQEAASATASADIVRIEEFPERLQKYDDAVAGKLEEVRVLVDREAAAKNITEPLAQSLRWSLRTTATFGASVDVRAIVSTMRVPTDNSALTQAVKELETTYAAVQAQSTALATDVARDVRQRVREAIRTAAKPADLEALQASLANANEALRKRALLAYSEAGKSLSSAEQVLHGLRRMIELEAAGKPDALGRAMNQFNSDFRYGQDTQFGGEIQARVDRVIEPFAAKVETAEEELAAAFAALKPSAEIEVALARFEEAAERLTPLRQNQNNYNQRDLRQSATSYRSILKAVTALAESEGDNPGAQQMSDARNAVRQVGGKRAAALDAMLTKLETQIADKAAKMVAERGEKLRARIAAAKQPADIDEIVTDLRRWESTASRSGFGELAARLSTLSTAWATNSPALLQQNRINTGDRTGAACAGELAALQVRAEREILSRALSVPELNAPPLAEKSADAALDALCDELVTKGEWRRLYDLLNARAAIEPNSGRRSETDAVTALRSFFTGQNLELAEQWADAMQSYKSVLRSASPRAPIKPAAERIKILTKKYPDLSKLPPPAARPGFSEPLDQ